LTVDAILTYRKIFRVWSPLAATWLMMSAEGPFLAAIIARLDDPTYNLAAYGVTFSFAIIVEAPIIMILSASTALVKDWDSFLRLRNFTYVLNVVITAAMLFVLWPPLFYWLTRDVILLPSPVAELTHRALAIMLPWPAAIGYRRFFQGLMIRRGLTRRIGYGTAIRVSTMATTAVLLYRFFPVPGAIVGAAALSCGVVVESVITRFMVFPALKEIREAPPLEPKEHLTVRRIVDFYIPLALTSIISLAVHPLVTYSLGRSHQALESLAVFPVVTAVAFFFRSTALSYQEVAIAFLDDRRENFRRLARFATVLGVAATLGLMLIAFTPLSAIWFHDISGLSQELSELSVLPLRILSFIPFFSVLLSFQRSIMVYGRHTRPVTVASVVEVVGIIAVLFLGIHVLGVVGAVAGTTALLLGRLAGNAYLFFPTAFVLRATRN